MKLFKRNAKLTSSSLKSSVSPDEVTLAREAVDTLTGNLKSGAEQHQIAAKRMNALNKTISKMEAALVHTARLESDNAHLTSELRGAEKKLRQKTVWTDGQESKLFALKKQRDDFSQRLSDAMIEISQRDDLQKMQAEKLAEQTRQIARLEAQSDQDKDRLEAAQINVNELQEDIAQQAAELSTQRRRLAKLQKANEESNSWLEQKTLDSEEATKELNSLRGECDKFKGKLHKARVELEAASYEEEAQRALLEDRLNRRDDEVVSLKNQIDQFNTQMRINENTSSHYEDEIAALRQALEVERARNDRNEQRLHVMTNETERRADIVKESREEYEILYSKFSQAVEDLDTLQKINHAQKGKLELYASVKESEEGPEFSLDSSNDTQIDVIDDEFYHPILKAVT